MSEYKIDDDLTFDQNVDEFFEVLKKQDAVLAKALKDALFKEGYANDAALRDATYKKMRSSLAEEEAV